MWICLYIYTSFSNISSSLGLDVKSLLRLKSIEVHNVFVNKCNVSKKCIINKNFHTN